MSKTSIGLTIGPSNLIQFSIRFSIAFKDDLNPSGPGALNPPEINAPLGLISEKSNLI